MQDTLTRWRSEKTAAYLSAAVAAAERDTTSAKLVRDMAASAEKLRWYFGTFQDQSIRVVDLKEALKAANGEIRTIEMEQSTRRSPMSAPRGRA
jgi:choloylglycine hydrolase